MSNIETAQIIPLFGPRPKRKCTNEEHLTNLSAPAPRDEEGLTETCKNLRLRQARQDVWRATDAQMDYWLVSMKMEAAISYVQRFDVPEGALHPARELKDRSSNHWALVKKYREAWVRLMLTPAPTMREITWKRAQLKAEHHKYTGLKAERIEQAIADDVEFLKAHPTRRRDVQQ